MTIPNLQKRRFVILGLQQTGKSYLAKYILKQEPRHLIYDVLHEHQGFNRYLVDERQYSPEAVTELNLLIKQVILVNKPSKLRLFIIDEANRYCPPKPKPLPEQVRELNDFSAHYDLAFGTIARRPTQLHNDLVELAHYLFVFQLSGKNDFTYLEALSKGLGEAVKGLKPHYFVIINPNRSYQVHEPISLKT